MVVCRVSQRKNFLETKLWKLRFNFSAISRVFGRLASACRIRNCLLMSCLLFLLVGTWSERIQRRGNHGSTQRHLCRTLRHRASSRRIRCRCQCGGHWRMDALALRCLLQQPACRKFIYMSMRVCVSISCEWWWCVVNSGTKVIPHSEGQKRAVSCREAKLLTQC